VARLVRHCTGRATTAANRSYATASAGSTAPWATGTAVCASSAGCRSLATADWADPARCRAPATLRADPARRDADSTRVATTDGGSALTSRRHTAAAGRDATAASAAVRTRYDAKPTGCFHVPGATLSAVM